MMSRKRIRVVPRDDGMIRLDDIIPTTRSFIWTDELVMVGDEPYVTSETLERARERWLDLLDEERKIGVIESMQGIRKGDKPKDKE